MTPLPHPRRGGLLILAATIFVLPLFLRNDFHYDIAILIGINAIACVGLNLLIGYTGQISLGHAGFFGIGAYGSALLTGDQGWPALTALAAAALGVAALAFLIAHPILKLRGHYLAMGTLGMGIIFAIVLNQEVDLTGGPDGMPVAAFTVAGWEPSGSLAWYGIVGGVLFVTVWLALNLIDSPIGRALRAVHGSEIAAAAMGVDTRRYKVMVFVVSAVLACVAGSLFAHYSGFISPDEAEFYRSIELVTMVVLGGMASTYGAVIGAAVLTILPQVLTAFDDYEMVVFGLVLMGTMIFMRRGLVPSLALAIRERRR